MLSEVVKHHRRLKGWSLRQLADRCDISASTLSKVERNELSLTYDKLQQLATGLGVDVSALFHSVGESSSNLPGSRPLTRRSYSGVDDGEIISTPNYVYQFTHTDIVLKAFIPMLAKVKARTVEEFGPLTTHHGEEYTLVLEGSVTVITEHYSPLILKEGESVYLDSTMPHAYLNSSDGEFSKVLCISSALE